MNKDFKAVCLIALAFSQGALGDCGPWTLKVLNAVTRETKTYTYALGDNREVATPDFKKFGCSIEISQTTVSTGTGVVATVSCDSKNKDEGLSAASSAICTGLSHPMGTLMVFETDKKTGKKTGYDFVFSPN